MGLCKICGKKSLLACSKCHVTNYCGVQCQTKDWKQEHKKTCYDPASSAMLLFEAISTDPKLQENIKNRYKERKGDALGVAVHVFSLKDVTETRNGNFLKSNHVLSTNSIENLLPLAETGYNKEKEMVVVIEAHFPGKNPNEMTASVAFAIEK